MTDRELIAQAEALDKLCLHPFSATARANDVLDVAQRMKMELRAQAATSPADNWRHLKPFGYAPGGYMSECHACKGVFCMDKRAITCRPCAEKAYAAASPAPTKSGWWCAHCNKEVPGIEVTYSERHEVCGYAVSEASPAPEPVDQYDTGSRVLREVFSLCEDTQEKCTTPDANDFNRGRAFEAKGIARAMGAWYQSEFCGRSFMGEPVTAPPAAASPEPVPVAWREHVEQRIRTWRQRTMNKSGDCLAIDDFMSAESIDDLVDFVCDEWAEPSAPPAAAERIALEAEIAKVKEELAMSKSFEHALAGLHAGDIETLKAERDAAVADAERYRWLKPRLQRTVWCGAGYEHEVYIPDQARNDDLDAAIDAARKEGGK